MSHDVFISYSNCDKTVGDAMCAVLEGRQIRCWIAPRDILPGSPWGEAIIDAISTCRVLVLIYSAGSNTSHQVIREVERAVSKGIPILPFRIEDVPLSKGMEYCISTHHWLDALTPPLENHLGHLAETVKLLLARSGIPLAGAGASSPRNPRRPEVAIPSEPSTPMTTPTLTRSILFGVADDRVQEIVPRGVALPYTAVFNNFYVMKSDHAYTVRIPLYVGVDDEDGSDIPYAPYNAVKGDMLIDCPAEFEDYLTLEVHVDARQRLQSRGWFRSAPDAEITVKLDRHARSRPIRERLHLYERLEKVDPPARSCGDPILQGAVEKKNQLERLCAQFYTDGDQEDGNLFRQIVAQGNELLADIRSLEENYAPASLAEIAVPIAIPTGEPDTFRCPHCEEKTVKISPPTQWHIFNCPHCKLSFWYGVGSPPEYVKLQFAVEDALRSGDWRSLSQWIDFARSAGKPLYREALERGLSAGMTGNEGLTPDALFLDFLATLGNRAFEEGIKSTLLPIFFNGVEGHRRKIMQAWKLVEENYPRIQQGDASALATARTSLKKARDEAHRARDLAVKVKSIYPNDLYFADRLLKDCQVQVDHIEKLCRQNGI